MPQNNVLSGDVISYVTEGDPTRVGVYACRVPDDVIPGFYKDKFLMWMHGKWSYPGSDQKYRGEVTGWIGPLQRKM